MRAFLLRCLLTTSTLAGCSAFGVTDRNTVIGVIARDASPTVSNTAPAQSVSSSHIVETCCTDSPVLEAPDTVISGVSFEAILRTYGSNGCWRAAGYRESKSAMTIELTPHDEDGSEGKFCTMAVVRLRRTARLRFDSPGVGTIIVRGRLVFTGGGMTSPDSLVSVSKQVVVSAP